MLFSTTDDVTMTTSSLSQTINMTFDLASGNVTEFMSFIQPFDVPYIRVIFIVMYVLVFLCCVLGNGVVIYVILRHRKMRNVTNFFLANLAVSDLCVGLFCVLPNLSTFLSPCWVLGKVVCKLYYFIQCTSYTASVLILTLISLERYFAIIHPMLNKRITRMCLLRLAVVIIWLCAAIYGLPNLIAYDLYRVDGVNETLDFCVITGDWRIDMGVYSIVNFMVLYVLPLLLISVMYVRISSVLWKSGRNMGVTAGIHYTSKQMIHSRHISANTTCPRCTHNGPTPNTDTSVLTIESSVREINDTEYKDNLQRETSMDMTNRKPMSWLQRCMKSSNQWARSTDEQDHEVTRMCSCMADPKVRPRVKSLFQMQQKRKLVCNPLATRRKVIRLLICIILSFAVLVMPHHIRLLWQYWFASSMSFTFQHMLVPPITFLFFYANSALNPFLYALLSDHFRQAFVELLPSSVLCRKQDVVQCVKSTENRTTPHKASASDSSDIRLVSAQSKVTINGTSSMSTVL